MINKYISAGFGILAMTLAATISGCNSSENTTSTGGTDTQVSGIDSTVSGTNTTAVGVVTGFGSVYVNGVEFDSSGTGISVDGYPGNDDYDLGVGMVVTVNGTVNADGVTGMADSISFVDDLEGMVLANDVAVNGTGTINVMGQTVTATGLTVFESEVSGINAITDIVAGNIIEVSGHSSGSGTIDATRIVVKAVDQAGYQVSYPGTEMELKGIVSSLDTTGQTFSIGNLIVDYSQAIAVSDQLRDGLYVAVTSTIPPFDNGDGTFTMSVTSVQPENEGAKGISGEEGSEVGLQGVITSTNNLPGAFELDGQLIILDSGTVYEGDISAATLAPGYVVLVEGKFDASGQVVADTIQRQADAGSLLVYGDYVLSTNTDLGTLTLQSGKAFTVTRTTIFQDSLDVNDDHYLNLAALSSGDYVKIQATTDEKGRLVAVKLERDEAPAL